MGDDDDDELFLCFLSKKLLINTTGSDDVIVVSERIKKMPSMSTIISTEKICKAKMKILHDTHDCI